MFGKGTQLAANGIRIESGAEERAVERGHLALVKRPAQIAQLALDALAHLRSSIHRAQHFCKRHFDVAIRDAARRLGTGNLSGCVLVSTSRPCRMCETAASEARIARMVYGDSLTDAGPPS